MITASTTASVPMVRFWRYRNASAPSRMALEMSCITCVPVSLLITWRARNTAKIERQNADR